MSYKYPDVLCPYCDYAQDIDHDDGYGYEESETYNQMCSECDKVFVYTTSISYDHEAYKADCLNDGEHNYEPTETYPKIATKMRCSMCDEERQPTEEEMKMILTPNPQ